MKKRIVIGVVAVVSLVIGYGVGYWRGSSDTRQRVHVVVAWEKDAEANQQTPGKTGYDPFFTRGNPIPNGAK